MRRHRSKLRRLLAGPPLALLLASTLLSQPPVAFGPAVPGWIPADRPAPAAQPEYVAYAIELLSAAAQAVQGGRKDPTDPADTPATGALILGDLPPQGGSVGFGGSAGGGFTLAGYRSGGGSGGGSSTGSGGGGSGSPGGGGGGGSGGGGSGSPGGASSGDSGAPGGPGGESSGDSGAPGGPGGESSGDSGAPGGPSYGGLPPVLAIADTRPGEPAPPEFILPGETNPEPGTLIARLDLPGALEAGPTEGARATAVPEPASLALLGLALLGLGAARRISRAPGAT